MAWQPQPFPRESNRNNCTERSDTFISYQQRQRIGPDHLLQHLHPARGHLGHFLLHPCAPRHEDQPPSRSAI
jgi:hypothetical protein